MNCSAQRAERLPFFKANASASIYNADSGFSTPLLSASVLTIDKYNALFGFWKYTVKPKRSESESVS